LDCNSGPFEDGDRVVVQFVNQDWEQPKVIGFESNPKPCTRWIWVSVTDFIEGFYYQRTAKIDPKTREVAETHISGVLNADNIARRTNEFCVTREERGFIVDPTTSPISTIYWVPDHPHDVVYFGGEVAFHLNYRGERMVNCLYGPDDQVDPSVDGNRLYTWPEGQFIRTLTEPVLLVYGSTGGLPFGGGRKAAINDQGQSFVVGLDAFPNESGGRATFAIYDEQGIPIHWGPFGLNNFGIFAEGAAIDDRYAVASLWEVSQWASTDEADVTEFCLFVFDVETGSTVNSFSRIDRPIYDITIRGDELFVLSNSSAAIGQETQMTIEVFSLPDLVFIETVPLTEIPPVTRRANFGSID